MTASNRAEAKSCPTHSHNASTNQNKMHPDLEMHNRPSQVRTGSEDNVAQPSDSPASVGMSLRRLHCAIVELIDTEDTYLQHLRDLEQGYLNALRKIPDLDSNQIETIFGQIPGLRRFHETLAATLHSHATDLINLAQTFITCENQFSVLYVTFCINYPKAVQLLQHAEQHTNVLWKHMEQCKLSLKHKLAASNYLLKPVQRILQYRLLLEACSKHSFSALNFLSEDATQSIEHPFINGLTISTEELRTTLQEAVQLFSQASEKMQKVGDHINDRKRSHDVIQRLRKMHIQADQWGELVLMNRFRIPNKKDCRLALLFHSALVLCKYSQTATSKRSILSLDTKAEHEAMELNETGWMLSSVQAVNDVPVEIRKIFTCTNLMLVEAIPKDPLAFHILPFGNPKAQRTLRATTIDIKTLWCREIKRLILENYDATIPDKVRDILLNSSPRRDVISPIDKTSFVSRTVTTPSRSVSKRKPTLADPNPSTLQNCPDELPTQESFDTSATVKDAINPTTKQPEADQSNEKLVTPLSDLFENEQNLPGEAELTNILLQTIDKTSQQVRNAVSVVDSESSSGIQMQSPDESDGGGDFRCIAVEINEERSVEELVGTGTSRTPSILSLVSNDNLHSHTMSPAPVITEATQPSSTESLQGRQETTSPQSDPIKNVLYIDYPRASNCDPVTYDLTYDRYIAKARASGCLSFIDVDDLFSPLRNIPQTSSTTMPVQTSDGTGTHLHSMMSIPQVSCTIETNRWSNRQSHRFTTLLNSPTSETSSSQNELNSPNSGASSPRQVVSKIALSQNHLPRFMHAPVHRPPTRATSERKESSSTIPNSNSNNQSARPSQLFKAYHHDKQFNKPRSSSVVPTRDTTTNSDNLPVKNTDNFRFRTGPPSREGLIDMLSRNSIDTTRPSNTMNSVELISHLGSETSEHYIQRNGFCIPNGHDNRSNIAMGNKTLLLDQLKSGQSVLDPESLFLFLESPKLTRSRRKKSKAPSPPPLQGASLVQEVEASMATYRRSHTNIAAHFFIQSPRRHSDTRPVSPDIQLANSISNYPPAVGSTPPVKPPRKTVTSPAAMYSVSSSSSSKCKLVFKSVDSSPRNHPTASSKMNNTGRSSRMPSSTNNQPDKR